jgi:flagellar capping protein FliD
MLISESKIRDAIISKFGSQAEFSRKMKIAQPNVNRGIRTQNTKFMLLLKKAGIDINNLVNEEMNIKKLEEKLEDAEKKNQDLEKLVEHQFNLIKSYEAILKEQINKPY